MKKIFLLLCVFSLLSLNGQNKKEDSNAVNYKFRSTKENLSKTSRFDPEKLDFELIYNREQSLFKIVDKMELNQNQDYNLTSIIYGGNLIYYSNITTGESLFNVNYKGQSFNVIRNQKNHQWIIQNDFKIIDGFKCYKATTTIVKQDKGRNTIKTVNPLVWFTPDVPTSFGPFGLDGLPGLIIEGTIDGRAYFYADKIVKNNTQNLDISKPKNSLLISENDFDNIIAEDYLNIKKSIKTRE
jgi:GLPGLI family protein